MKVGVNMEKDNESKKTTKKGSDGKKKNTNKKATKNTEEVVKLEVINNDKNTKRFEISEGFYYLLGIVLSLVLIFATNELLSTINYLFVVIFAIISIVQIINFIMDKEYLTRNYSSMIISVMCAWMAMFIYKYGDFLFLEMLPVLVSLLLFIMATSSFTKYFDRKLTGNLIVSVISIILGVLLIFVSKSIMYILFKITGIYIFVMILLDFIDYKKNRNI